MMWLWMNVVYADALENVWKDIPVLEHIEQVHTLQLAGKYDAAQERLDFLAQYEPSLYVLFEIGRNWELQEQYDTALGFYDLVLQEDLGEDLWLNTSYRRALVLSDLQQHRRAVWSLRKLRWHSLSDTDKRAVDLAFGAALLWSGRETKGIKTINQALNHLESPMEHSWLQARARMALSDYLLNQALQIAIVPTDEMTNLVNTRSDLIIQAERQVQKMIQLQEPQYALAGLEDIGDALLFLYDDLLAMPAPEYFDVYQEQLYVEVMEARASILQEKALEYYEVGDRYAKELNWPGSVANSLQKKREMTHAERYGS